MSLFGVAILALLGSVYWATVFYLREKSDHIITVERALLETTYDRGGADGLVVLIDQRIGDRHFGDWAYLIVDHSLCYIGSLKSWPASLRDQGWGYLAPAPEETGRALLRVTYRVLPGDYHLLVGQPVDDLEGLVDTITTGLAWAVGFIILLAAAAGVSTARRSVGRIEAINATSRENYAKRAGRAHTAARDRR
jgi:hypothetical protein